MTARQTHGWVALDVGAVVHWVGQYEDDNASITGGKQQTPRTIPAGGEVTVTRTGQTFTAGEESPFARKVDSLDHARPDPELYV